MGKITAHRYEPGNEAAWLALRNSMDNRLGGSEIGAVANHSDYSNFLKELEYRVGAKVRPDISNNIAVMRGHFDEEFVATLFEKFSGKKVHRVNSIITNDDYPRLKASVDRLIYNEDSGLECKTANAFVMMKFANDEFPRSYLDQCELYLAVTGKKRWYLAILDGNNSLHIFLMTREKSEEERWNQLRKKFALTVNETDADAGEWHNAWEWLDAVYYVDNSELAGCEARAEHFFAKVDEVKALMATQKWNSETERQVVLTNVIAQVVDPEDYGEGAALDEAIGDITAISVPDSELILDPTNPDTLRIKELLESRKSIHAEAEEFATSRGFEFSGIKTPVIDAEIKLKMNTAEKACLPGWKITYKLGTACRTASIDAVETYFQSQGVAVPDGIISVGEPNRSLRIAEVKPKGAKRSVVRAASAA